VGTIGGGTQLDSQDACLNMIIVKGENVESPMVNAQRLVGIGARALLVRELSLMFSLAIGQLVKIHMKFKKRIQTNKHHLINDLIYHL
jgi:hydroxymethylglutaryl-CoA reductase (NADPH)